MFTWHRQIDGRTSQSVAESVGSALDGIAAQSQTAWFKQHDRNGAHKDVTASSLAIDGPVTLSRLSFAPTPFTQGAGGARGAVVSPDIGGTTVTTAWHFAGADRAGLIVPNLTSGGATLYGFSVVNRQAGDVVGLVNFEGYNADLTLRLNPTGSFEGEFAGSRSTADVDVVVPRGRWVWLLLLNLPQSTGLRWHVSMF